MLIVDDDELIRSNLAQYLSGDYITYTAYNGNEAIRNMNENSDIEVVLSDLKCLNRS